MNILLLDDEPLVIQDIAASINWESLDFHHVFLAYSVSDAMSEFEKHSIDFIICDIEMPKVNGLQFLAWVKERSPSTKSIILTCHPLFDYAQEALRLNCIDYMLKPIDIDALESILQNVANEFRQSTSLHNQQLFWKQCINGTYSDHAILQKAIDKYGLYSNSSYITLLIRATNSVDSSTPDNFANQALDKVTMVFSDFSSDHSLFLDYTHTLFGVFHTTPDELHLTSKQICSCLEDIRYNLSTPITVFFCECKSVISAVHSFSQLRSFSAKAKHSTIKTVDSASDSTHYFSTLQDPYSRIHEDSILKEIESQISSCPVSLFKQHEILILMRQEIEDWFFTFLASLNVSPLDAFSNVDIHFLREEAVTEKLQFFSWAKFMLAAAVKESNHCQKLDYAVIQAQEYIQSNIQLDLSRKDVASKVFLNVDYLDRRFRNELGLSITQYILQQKLNLAKDLLTHTQKSISDIANAIGYNSLSSFSYMFKHETGTTPLSYRHNAKSEIM